MNVYSSFERWLTPFGTTPSSYFNSPVHGGNTEHQNVLSETSCGCLVAIYLSQMHSRLAQWHEMGQMRLGTTGMTINAISKARYASRLKRPEPGPETLTFAGLCGL